jgi:site-specific DNA-methyltransferase (adenine-specific)
MEKREKPVSGRVGSKSKSSPIKYNDGILRHYDKKYPQSIYRICKEIGLHPTQKPVALYEYLIRTYTNEGDTVLDFTCGSGTTGVACMRTNRNFIGIEKELKYFEIAQKRIAEAAKQPPLL